MLNKNKSVLDFETGFDADDYPESSIDIDHCHFSANFVGWAHEKCNRAHHYVNFIPVVGKNIEKYDLYHICLALKECERKTTPQVIPTSDGKTSPFSTLEHFRLSRWISEIGLCIFGMRVRV